MSARRLALTLAGGMFLVASGVLLFQPRLAPRPVEAPRSAAELRPKVHHSRTPDDGLTARAPNPWFFLERAYPRGRIPRAEWHRARHEARRLREEARARSGLWVARGPTNIGGRITDLAVDPVDADIVYAAAAEGGVLRSRNGGQSWTPLFDDQPTLSVGALAIDPLDRNVIYAGTGEVNPGGGSVAYGGVGLFRSVDAGDTWQPLGLEETGSIGRIVIDPTNPQRIYVAAMGHLWEAGPERGVYRSLDGGSSWERVLSVSDSTGCVDLVLRPDRPRVILAAMWERIRRPGYFRYGGSECAVYRSTDGGDGWSMLGGGLPAPSADGGRIGLSLCVAQPDVMHVVYADRVGYFDGLYRSTDGGASWSRTSDAALADVFASYGWWFGNVRTHPVDPDRIFVLGLEFWRSTNGGSSYGDASGSMHVDHHALAFGPGSNPVMVAGNDGGVYRSTNGGTAWTKLPDLPITQMYRVALDPSNPDAIYGGAQDNGTVRTLNGDPDAYDHIFGGDGFQSLVHPLDPARIWAQYQYGNLYYSMNGGGSWSLATSGIQGSDRNNWNSPLIQDPTDPDRRYFGTHRVYRSTGPTSWSAISPDLTGGASGSTGQVAGTLTTLAVSPLDPAVIWAGSDDGRVHVVTENGGSWGDVSASLPDRWITSVRADPFSRETAYVTVSGFRWAEPLPHVFRTTDLGATWTPIAGNLPEAPINDLVADPDQAGRLFVGTDVGVYETLDGGITWSMVGSNLPGVVVTHLGLDPVGRVLTAATYGRSFFSYSLEPAVAVGDPGLTGPDGIPGGRAPGRVLAPAPNPARAGVTVRWDLNLSGGDVRVEVVTVAGRRVWSGSTEAARGPGRLFWDGRDLHGTSVTPGVYFARVEVEGRLVGSETIVIGR